MLLPYHNLKMNHQNPGAVMPLVLPINVICNTSDEDIYSNIRSNSRLDKKWISAVEPHGKTAILCGSGPSLADSLKEIRSLWEADGVVFSMNGSAKYLQNHGILPDYQVILDARIETADLIGPAKKHLFASQAHPECFKRCPDADLWQLQVTGIDDLLPEYDEAYSLVGGAASVGNTTLCLAYVMGYRHFEIFGYDSSHKDGAGHAFRQPMNDGDPCAYIDFNGKSYMASLTMKLQAEKFQGTAAELKSLGCTINVNGYGLLPDIYNTPKEVMSEKDKYVKMWGIDGYRQFSPGLECIRSFIATARPDSTIIDFGCGSGKASIELARLGYDVILTDFTENSRDKEAMKFKFVLCDLTDAIPVSAQFGICADVMEHIPTDMVKKTIDNIMGAAETVFFQISTVPDNFGAVINQVLHLTVKPPEWWESMFSDYVIRWSRSTDIDVKFLVRRK